MYIWASGRKIGHYILNNRSIVDMFFMMPDYDGRSVTVIVTVISRNLKEFNVFVSMDSA